ncbi:MAG TPA: hypothetical protein VMA77_18945 [Solirubrobacteraceae bacterium]|nr:hypothetical protein [Solirubrobacteraceae bacterium]
MSATASTTPRRPASTGRPARPMLVAVLSFQAFTLAVFSTLHLTGALSTGTGGADAAGIAEGLICIGLAGGAWGLAVEPPARGHRAARLAVGFAIVGFIVGLTETVQGHDAIDLIYHATMLPLLVATAVLLARQPAPRRGSPAV